MNAIERLADAMLAEGIFQVRRWPTDIFTVELMDGRTGQGNTPRQAIEAAKAVGQQVAS